MAATCKTARTASNSHPRQVAARILDPAHKKLKSLPPFNKEGRLSHVKACLYFLESGHSFPKVRLMTAELAAKVAAHDTKIAVHDTEIAGLKAEVSEFRQTQKQMAADVHAIREAIAEGKGGWKLAVAFGIPALVGGVIVAAAHKLWP